MRYMLLMLLVSCSALLHAQASQYPAQKITAQQFTPAKMDADGRFTNANEVIDKGGLAAEVPFMLRRFATYLRSADGAPGLTVNDGEALRANADNSTMTPTVTWVGHATFLVQMSGVTFLVDPIWSNTPSPVPLIGPSRFVPPGIALADLPSIDFVLVSHNHYDHLDLPTLGKLAERNSQTQFFVPEGNGVLLRRAGVSKITELNWGEQVAVGQVVIHCLPAQHWSKRSLTDNNKALWSSWAVTSEQRRFYHAGDTGYFDGFKAIGEHLGPFDLAAVPIGAYAPRAMMRASHMNPEEAITAALDLRAQVALAMHFGTFDLSDEPLQQPPIRFRQAAKVQGLAATDTWVLKVGETRAF